MKKYLITLAAMALAVGGSINFAGCSGGPAEDPNALGESTNAPPSGMSDEQKKMAKEKGFDIGNENTGEGTGKAPE
ncbi:MAG: hypothetical protein QF685_03725 [Verrucomicrobiota bacterium]|jgi:hypothetical protein|nr:hypothetical protein [Verrucomicrobiota bacterium]